MFREHNEHLERKVVDLELGTSPTPYLCECEDERCTTVVGLTLAEYEGVRANPRGFFVASGHESSEDRVLDHLERFTLVEKLDEEGRLVEARDPRA
jgi:hypothetical protein